MKKVNNNDAIIKHLAEKVMGFEKREDGRKNEYWEEINGDKFGLFWNPLENIEQAMKLLDTFGGWSMIKPAKRYHVVVVPSIINDSMCRGTTNNQSLPMAISIVCAEATGYKE